MHGRAALSTHGAGHWTPADLAGVVAGHWLGPMPAALAAASAERCILIGPGFAATAAPTPSAQVEHHSSQPPTLAARILADTDPATCILVKGSRAMALDRLVEELSQRTPSLAND
ncbi:hypothetical protein [Marichromatium sp. AB32]|uniref:hypothetical protein n=1 Tax=Marichromatium sp. AB32 TaxID=2483363 RepID=UPI000F3CC3D9|nr:hypothetical protein [Marichromatium sp. AB32]RNE94321.1 hypothetical protein EBL85_02580 [Marichromatium sp. AB32]